MTIGRREFAGGIAASLALCGIADARSRPDRDEVLLFAYFGTGKEEALGLKLALSEDGFAFRELAQGRSFLPPEVGESRLMRDPFVFRGEGRDAPWHMLWTTAWEGRTIGHATSRDLRQWSAQRAIPVMEGVNGVRNCWAPEAIWDPKQRHHVIFWSSTVDGMFPDVAAVQGPKNNHRLWYVTTRDFATFSAPAILYDPGFSVIDGTFARAGDGRLYLIVKDETGKPAHKHLRVAAAASPTGPFGPLAPPFTPDWVEGPMTTTIGDRTICYYDVYTAGRWGAKATRDFVRWEDVTARLAMPRGARHGSLLRIPRAVAQGLEAGPVTD